MTSARRFHAVLLPNGQVLAASGQDPNFSSLSSAVKRYLASDRQHAGRSLHSGGGITWERECFARGGFDYSNGSFISSLASAEVFKPSTAEWTSIASMPCAGGAQASLLANWDVFVVRDAFFTPGTGV